jgi:hypothetical protein
VAPKLGGLLILSGAPLAMERLRQVIPQASDLRKNITVIEELAAKVAE